MRERRSRILRFETLTVISILVLALVPVAPPAAISQPPIEPPGDRFGFRMQVSDIHHVGRRFFHLVDPVDPLGTGELVAPDDPDWIAPPAIDSLTVWKDDRNQNNNAATLPGLMYLDPGNVVALNDSTPPDSLAGHFDILYEHVDYVLRTDLFFITVNESTFRYPVIDLLRPIGAAERLGAAFTARFVVDGQPTTIRVGTTPAQIDTARLKALRVADSDFTRFEGEYFSAEDFWYGTRQLELRSIYSLAQTVGEHDLIIVEARSWTDGATHLPGEPDVTYLRMLGADREDDAGNPGFDGRMDQRLIRRPEGLIVLPDLRPFAPSARDSVWPFYWADYTFREDPPASSDRPAFFTPELANRAPYDKRSIHQQDDRRYYLDIGIYPEGPVYEVGDPYPNPFRGTLHIPVFARERVEHDIHIYGVDGRHLRTLVPAGTQAYLWRWYQWDGRTDQGVSVTSGVYFIRIRIGGTTETRKVVRIR